jgi:DNA-binding XRE family transcriptional regulator
MYDYKLIKSNRFRQTKLRGNLGNNFVKKIREEHLLSKAELARKAGVSTLTMDRIEKGLNCRMETKRKIILALGYELSDKDKIFPGE